jgi:hypothetical protein
VATYSRPVAKNAGAFKQFGNYPRESKHHDGS